MELLHAAQCQQSEGPISHPCLHCAVQTPLAWPRTRQRGKSTLKLPWYLAMSDFQCPSLIILLHALNLPRVGSQIVAAGRGTELSLTGISLFSCLRFCL